MCAWLRFRVVQFSFFFAVVNILHVSGLEKYEKRKKETLSTNRSSIDQLILALSLTLSLLLSSYISYKIFGIIEIINCGAQYIKSQKEKRNSKWISSRFVLFLCVELKIDVIDFISSFFSLYFWMLPIRHHSLEYLFKQNFYLCLSNLIETCSDFKSLFFIYVKMFYIY